MRDDLAALLSERFAAADLFGRGLRRAGRADFAHCRPDDPSVRAGTGHQRRVGLLARPGARLVTLTGPGGVGKTRLAVAAGERLRLRFGGNTVFVPLAAVTDPGFVLSAIGRAPRRRPGRVALGGGSRTPR